MAPKAQNAKWVGIAVPSDPSLRRGEAAANMYCLLCHEKIPRLRAWRTKSEFCCDEHAALYKKQTLERLLVDPGVAQAEEQPSLPEPPDPEAFENDEAGFDLPEDEPATLAVEASAEPPQEAEQKGFIDESLELPPPADMDSGDGADELWRLASEVEHEELASVGYGDYSDEPRSVKYQSAEEALEALRRLASRATKTPEEEEEAALAAERPPADFSFEGRDTLRGAEDFREALEEPDEPTFHESGFSEPVLEEAVPEPSVFEEPEERFAERAEALDVEEDSVLDDLLAEPPQPEPVAEGAAELDLAPPESELDLAPPEPEVVAEIPEEPKIEEQAATAEDAAAALRALVDTLENDPALTDEELRVDMEAPEPDWISDSDASSELSALKESLREAGAGSTPEPEDALPEAAHELSPDEPEWDELASLELDEEEVDPPMPDLDGELGLDANEAAPFPEALEEAPEPEEPQEEEQPAAKAALNGAVPAPKKSYVRKPPTRFRPIMVFAEIRIEMATWPAEAPKQEYSAEPAPVAGRADVEHSLSPLGPQAGLPPSGHALDAEANVSTGASESAAAKFDVADILPPQPKDIYLPPGLVAGTGRNAEWNMHEDSVDLEPAPVLELSSTEELEPVLSGAAAPFEPEGLFFELAGGGPAKDA